MLYLLSSISPRLNIPTDKDNLIVKIICYDKGSLDVNGYSTVLMKLRCVIRFVN